MSAVPNAMHELLKFIICMIWVKFIFQLSFSWLGWGQGIGKDHVIKFIWQQKWEFKQADIFTKKNWGLEFPAVNWGDIHSRTIIFEIYFL